MEIYLTPLQNPGKNINHQIKIYGKKSEIFLYWILVIQFPKCAFDSEAVLILSKFHGVEFLQLY